MIERLSLSEAVTYLQDNPMEIKRAWFETGSHQAGALFAYASPNGRCSYGDGSIPNGCLTQIKRGSAECWDSKDMTEEIRLDGRVPASPDEITIESLSTFLYWQERIQVHYELAGLRKPVTLKGEQ